jgi:hypothetical protein
MWVPSILGLAFNQLAAWRSRGFGWSLVSLVPVLLTGLPDVMLPAAIPATTAMTPSAVIQTRLDHARNLAQRTSRSRSPVASVVSAVAKP